MRQSNTSTRPKIAVTALPVMRGLSSSFHPGGIAVHLCCGSPVPSLSPGACRGRSGSHQENRRVPEAGGSPEQGASGATTFPPSNDGPPELCMFSVGRPGLTLYYQCCDYASLPRTAPCRSPLPRGWPVPGPARGSRSHRATTITEPAAEGQGWPALCTSHLLRLGIWPSFRASSGLAPCDVLNKYASGPSPCGCPVARPSPPSRDGVSCIMRARPRFHRSHLTGP
jgi:hypothetical protein